MAAYYMVEVMIYPHSNMFAHTVFNSRAKTGNGILRAASKALRKDGYRTFEEPTAEDVYKGTDGRLVSIAEYQSQGLFK